MATSNKERVGRALDLVAAGLGPWMVDLLTRKYGPTWQEKVVQAAGVPPRGTERSLSDPSYLFWIFDKQWHTLFRQRVGFEEKRCVSGLWDARNDWAHGGRFTDERAERVLSDAEFLLRSIGAVAQADEVDEMRRDLRRIRYEKDQANYRKEIEGGLDVQVGAGLPAWRDVVEPHDDVARGEFELAQFAADLRLVAQGKAGPEYANPTQFFQRTYLTRGLTYLLTQTAKRLNGVGGEPVVDLMTTFGGGKTHSQIAVWHVGSGTPVDEMPGMAGVLQAAGVSSLPASVQRAVVVGNDLSVLGSRKADGTQVNTLWGEIAWQLGGPNGFARIAQFDENGDPPPTSALEDLLSAHAPAIVLIDEWVAYLRQLYSRPQTPPAGTFDAHMTFVQSLTEAVKAVPTALLVASLPASDNVRDMGDGLVDNAHEIGGTAGLEALRALRSVIHRVEHPWQPADIEESYEIVRRRLFKTLDDPQKQAARDVVLHQFATFYDKNAGQLPSEVRQPGYTATMRTAYPIHPEVFRRLYEDWSTLERFQRTRGVLRLMATVIHALWWRGDTAPLITPATIPLDDQKVFEEITLHLDDPWKPVVDTDIAGPSATAATIDRELPILGKSMAARRVARCVFLGTAPAANRLNRGDAQGPVRGIETKRVVLGATYPGDNPAHLADALRVLADRGAFMNRDGDRYWLSLQQTVQRLVQERADSYSDDEVTTALIDALRAEKDRGVFERVHRWPSDSAAVEDDPSIGLVVLGTHTPHSRKASSQARDEVLRFVQYRGTNARIHKNTLVFLAPDIDRVATLHEAVRQQLAWQYVVDNVESLNLDQHNIAVARRRRTQAGQTVTDRIRDTYRWLIVPHQQPGAADIDLDTILVDSTGTLAERVTRKTDAGEIVLRSITPGMIRREIDRLHLWKDQPHVQVDRLAGLFTQYLYMPKVASHIVIKDAIRHLANVLLVDQDGFAYADSVDEDGVYHGLVLDTEPAAVSNTGLLVAPEAARAQLANQPGPSGGDTPGSDTTGTIGTGGTRGGSGITQQPTSDTGGQVPPPVTGHRRFHASKTLNPLRAVRDISQLNDEILIHFTSSGVQVNITVDLDSEALDQLPPDKRSIVEENLRTLSFDDWGLE